MSFFSAHGDDHAMTLNGVIALALFHWIW